MRKFKVQIGLEDVGQFEKFTDAFRFFYAEIKKFIAGGTSWQALETTNFITLCTDGFNGPMDFYTARDFAYEIGLLVGNGELQEIEEPDFEIIYSAFVGEALLEAAVMLDSLGEKFADLAFETDCDARDDTDS